MSALPSLVLAPHVYIGSHFEVRDHNQPTKYVFNGPTRVASVIGALSAAPRVQRVRLWEGWNLISLAVSVSNLVEQFRNGQPAGVQAFYKWNAQTSDYSPIAPGQAVSRNTVLWVRTTTNASVGLLGTYAEPANRSLPAAGAYLAGAGLESWSPVFPAGASQWQYNAELSRWWAQLGGDLELTAHASLMVAPGQALFVEAAAPAVLQGPDPSLRLRYYHQDHLGSSSVVTDAGGKLVEELAYYPFGAPRIQHQVHAAEEPYGFTQKERDRESRLNYFEARFLSSALDRFISPDPKYASPDAFTSAELQEFLAEPQRLGLYAYVRNNPLTSTDPTGLQPKVVISTPYKAEGRTFQKRSPKGRVG